MEIGTAARDFQLPDESEQTVRLSALRGKWVVLYFYPRDNTPGCTTEALEFTYLLPEFSARNTEILGISPDTCGSHHQFRIKHDLGIRLLSDPEHRVIEDYGAWGEKKMYGRTFAGVIRSTVLVDPAGMISRYWPRVRARGHAAEVLSALLEIQAKAKS